MVQETTGKLTDDDLDAIAAYVNSLPPPISVFSGSKGAGPYSSKSSAALRSPSDCPADDPQ